MSSESTWKIRDDQYGNQDDIGDPSVDVPLSDLCGIDENSFYASNNVSDVEDYDQHGSDLFTPLPLSELRTSFLERTRSFESESTASASISARTSFNHQQHQYQLSRQQSAKGQDIYQEDELIKDDPKSVDELMASELNKLSFQERETINEEIHGVDVYSAGVKESPALLTESFRQLDIELQRLRPRYAAFDRSQRLFGATTYLSTEKLRIMFLRCDLFDAKKAAERLCNFAEVMLEFYGEIALQRRPQISDLTEFEVSVLESGNYTILPGRDRAGRRIIANLAFDAPEGFGYYQRCRTGSYVVLCLMDDVETQQKGVVALSWWHDVSVDDFMIRRKVHEKIKSMPMRMGAFHCCIPSEVMSDKGKKVKDNGGGISSGMAQLIKAMFVVSVGPKVRPHLRFHTGSVVECVYALQSFGINSDQIPINGSTGKLKTKHHLKWLEFRRRKEESLRQHSNEFDRIIECPKQSDILFGRGRPIMRHPGNAVLRNVIEQKMEEYASAKSKKQTTNVTWEVVRILKGNYGARFLKEENVDTSLGWIEVSNEIARQKVRIAFRDLRTKIAKSTNEEVDAGKTRGNIANPKRKGETSYPLPTPSTVLSLGSTKSEERFQQRSSFAQEINSSTSVFLNMDGIDAKRQRLCF